MPPAPDDPEVREALGRFVEGREVARVRLNLREGGEDHEPALREALRERGWRETTVAEAPVAPGRRMAALLLRGGVAHFGWIFWEKFHEGRARKLFGSAAKDARGDWAIQLGRGARETVWANPAEVQSVDIDFPSSF